MIDTKPNAVREGTKMQEQLTAIRRQVAIHLSTAEAMRIDEGARLVWLERAVEAQREAARIDQAIKGAYEPCRMCGRKVATPCHDAEGYYEGGPWDAACQDFARGDRAAFASERGVMLKEVE